MAVIQFGHTWWGQKWLQSLDEIDFSNRLPRGQRYARNGSVQSIEFYGPVVEASVSGRQPEPYTVNLMLWEFSKKERKTIVQLIEQSVYYQSQLEARVLPPELYDDLLDLKIKLFPSSWKELRMSCSCPDWAVPCKHLASVVYLIANEIDKNPFFIFQLHAFDLLDALYPDGLSGDVTIPELSSFSFSGDEVYHYQLDDLNKIDFTAIPDLGGAIQGLLSEFPLFYPKKDFKQIIEHTSSRMSKHITRFVKGGEINESLPDLLVSSGGFQLQREGRLYTASLVGGGQKLDFSADDPSAFIEYLQQLAAGDLSVYPQLLSYLVMVHSFAQKLIEQHAIVPEIYSIEKVRFRIRWIPALFNPEIACLFQQLVDSMPKPLLWMEGQTLQKCDQLLFLLSFIICYYYKLFSPLKGVEGDPILSLFFSDGEYVPSRFEERENAQTIHLWLARLFCRPIHHHPMIRLEESESSFLFDIDVRDDRQDDKIPIPLSEYLREDDDEKRLLLRDLYLLSSYLPTVNTYLRKGGTLLVDEKSFVPAWFQALPALRTLGISTVLPKVLQECFTPQLLLSFHQKPNTSDHSVISYTSLAEMMDFHWEVSIGSETMLPEQFLELVKRYRGLVRYKDRYLVLHEEDLKKIQKQMERTVSPGALDLLRLSLEGHYKDIPIRTDENLRKSLDQIFRWERISPPEGLRTELREYQEEGFQWLYHNYKTGLGSLIADDMGLGKTVQVLALLLKLKEEGNLTKKRPAIIVVPASLTTNWERELARFTPEIEHLIYHGPDRLIDSNSELIITTYAVLSQDLAILKKRKWSLVIIDEAQNIKNPDSARTKAVKALGGSVKIAMSGTPVENRLMDYWSVLDFIMKSLLGNKKTFKERYAIPIERFRDKKALTSFRNLTGPFILRRMKSDKEIINDLPEKMMLNRYSELTEEQAALYQGLIEQIDELVSDSQGIKRSGIIFKLISGLKQICNHPALYLKEGSPRADRSGKALLLLEILRKILLNNEKVLIFTQFARMGQILQEIISEDLGEEAPFFYGALSRKQRDQMVDRFQRDDSCRIMIISLKAGGLGLNLTAANHVVHYDLWWNPAVQKQASDRAFRIGQKKDVEIHRFITQGTFEERINDMLEDKQDLADLTVAQGEKWIGNMRQKELKELLQLER